jgi:hypothetical protein
MIFVLSFATVTAASAGADLTGIPLVWKPTDAVSSYDAIDLTVFQNVTFVVHLFNDVRKKPSEIGKNVEKRFSSEVRYVSTRDNVSAWLADRFGEVLSEFEIDVVKTDGTYTLEGDIVKFYVTEESMYKADVGLKMRLLSKSGVVWEGMVTASSTRWGSSYKAENYYEGLSNAVISAVHSLLKDEAFKQAVLKNKK